MRALVTGGAGFIGSHLCDRLAADGHEITIVDDLSSGAEHNLSPALLARLVRGDIRDLPSLVGDASFDVVVHLAARISGYESLERPDEYVDHNVLGLLRVIDVAARAPGTRIVFASSATIYGDRGGAPCTELDLPAPATVYGLTKLAGEHVLRLYAPLRGYHFTCLRLFNVYGPRQSPEHPYANVTCKFSRAAALGLPIQLFGDGEQTRDFVYVDDVVRAMMAVLELPPGKAPPILNVGTGHEHSIIGLLTLLGQITGRPLSVERKPSWPNDVRRVCADVSRQRAALGIEPTPLAEGLRQTVAYFAERARSEADRR